MIASNIAMWVLCAVAGVAVMALPEDSNPQTAACWVAVLSFVAGLATLLPAAGGV